MLLWSLAFASPGLEALSAGDRARWSGDREQAVTHYREAAATGEAEAEAMARLRLLAFTGNWGLLVHGARIDRALADAQGPWGELAWADFHLFAPPQLGADRAEAERIARAVQPVLPGPALARLFLATGDPRWLEELRRTPWKDGLGEGLLASGGALHEPGTWMLGVGVAAAPGAGVGGGVTFIHPDLAWAGWRFALQAAATSRGTWVGAVSTRGPGRTYAWGAASGGHTVADLWVDDARTPYALWALSAEAGPGWRLGRFSLEPGARARWDNHGAGWSQAFGPVLRAS